MDTSQNWNLFGYDLRRIVQVYRGSWREFLWGDRSPVLGMIDEVVPARLADGETAYYQAGASVAVPADAQRLQASAVVLPDRLALLKVLRVPLAAETELDALLALEVRSSSPFPESDTCSGWTVTDRTDTELELQLALSSRSAVMEYVAGEFGSHDPEAQEVWVQAGDRVILLAGFGERGRQQRNRGRVLRMAAIAAYCLLLLVLLFALMAWSKYLQLEKAREILSRVEASAQEAVALRTALSDSRSRMTEAAELLARYPSPHGELLRLTAVLDDDTWLSRADFEGGDILLEGESADASAVMQQLLGNPAYASVVAPAGTRKSRSGQERFAFNLTLAAAGGEE